MRNFIILSCLLHAAIAAPQLITFKDGKVGVNFLGYHAEAGLGGGQNSQNGLLGGLHASAGTPWGQNAAAGLGGNVNGRAAGTLYAGAQATPDVGASAVLGGDTSKGGYGAAESYVPGKVNSRTHTVDFANRHRDHKEQHEENHDVVAADIPPATEGSNNVIQKVKPHKKYRGDQTHIRKSVEKRQLIAPGSLNGDSHSADENSDVPAGRIVNSALQIPIGILQSLQQSFARFP